MLELVLQKIVFLASDGASVDCGKDSRLIRLIIIAGGFSLYLIYLMFQPTTKVDTSLKDALNDFIETFEATPRHLYYLYIICIKNPK